MDRHERTCGVCALVTLIGLAQATGCGNSIPELLQPLSMLMIASGTGSHGELVNGASKNPEEPVGGFQTKECQNTGSVGKHRGGGEPDAARIRAREHTSSGSPKSDNLEGE